MKNISFNLTGSLACLAVSMSGCSLGHEAVEPNIIIILGDDLGYADIGCYGQKIIETPNIDALTKTGIRFTNYYSGSPVSAPSRYTLLTGKHSGHSFIRGNHEWSERGDVWNFVKMEEDPSLEGQYPIPAETVTFSKILQQQGYKTGCVGKWGLGAPYTDGVPNKQGFDFFFGYNCQRQAHTYYPQHLWRNEQIVRLNNSVTIPRTSELDGDKDPYKPESYARYNLTDYSPALMLKEALGFLDSAKDKPFLLHFTTTIPHVPMQAPADLVARYHEKIGDEEPYLGDKGYFPCRYPMATYAAMVSYLDFQVGELVRKLKELGEYENTIIIFSSDNGPVITGGANGAFFQNAAPFNMNGRRLKGTVYEGGIHVPLIISWPSKIRESVTSDLICAAYDMLPTLCDLSGADKPGDLDGISLVPTILNKGKQPMHEYLYWEFPEGRGQQAVRIGDWKGIRDSTKSGNIKIQLFNLANDIKELSDVAAQHPEIVGRIEKIMKESHQPPEIERFNIFKSN